MCFGYTLKENLLLTKTVHQVLPDTLYFPPLSGHDFDICSCPIIGLEQLLTGFWKTVPLRKTLPHVNHLHTRNITDLNRAEFPFNFTLKVNRWSLERTHSLPLSVCLSALRRLRPPLPITPPPPTAVCESDAVILIAPSSL